MSTFTYLVTVETEKTTGLIASRDEQSEKIVEEIESLDSYVDISGIGARSDSDYRIVSVDVQEMDKVELKHTYIEYDKHVREEEPTNKELRVELKTAKEEAARYKSLYEQTKANFDALLQDPKFTETRIYTQDRNNGTKTTRYLPDGRYDNVYFRTTAGDDAFSMRINDDNDIEIRYNGMGREMLVIPRSGNEVLLRAERRRV